MVHWEVPRASPSLSRPLVTLLSPATPCPPVLLAGSRRGRTTTPKSVPECWFSRRQNLGFFLARQASLGEKSGLPHLLLSQTEQTGQIVGCMHGVGTLYLGLGIALLGPDLTLCSCVTWGYWETSAG